MPMPNSEPEDIATPEGDLEEDPTAPPPPPADGLETPPGSAPNPYDSDAPKPEGLEKFIDEVVRGEYM